MRRAVTVMALGLAGVIAVAGPASADPAGPTHYRATVTGIEAADGAEPGVDVEILGGDAFVVVRADAGTAVDVPGYDGEPYIRIDPDGAVHVNQLSPSRWMNDERYGSMEVPAHADAEAPPQWTLAARDGEYSWHDHRVHFMSPAMPPQVDPDADTVQPIRDWTLPLTVDGRDVTVSGDLVWIPGPGPVVPFGVVLVAVLLAVAVVLRWPAAVVQVVLVGAVATGVAGVAKMLDVPAGGDGEPALVVLPVLAAILLLVGVSLGRRGLSHGRLITSAAGIPVFIWGILQASALTRPIVPGPLSVEVVRVVVAIAFAVGAASVLTSVRALMIATPTGTAAPTPAID